MKCWKRRIAMLMAVTMVVTMLPQTAYATEVSQSATEVLTEEKTAAEKLSETEAAEADEEATEKVSEETAGEAVTEETEEVTEEVTEEAAEETTEALESEEENKAEVVEEYTLLTVGQTLHQTTADSVLYAFEPEESGWYRIQAFCASGDEPWMNVEKTIYYTWDEEEQIKVEHEYGLSNSWAKGGSDVNRMVWLNQEERYFINAGAEKYANDHAIDIAVCITKADITGLETVQTPAEDSFGCLWLKGMQIQVNLSDGTHFITEPECRMHYDSQGHTYSDNYMSELQWNMAYEEKESINTNIYVDAYDGQQNASFDTLEPGTHLAELYLEKSIWDENGHHYVPLKFTTNFNVVTSNVESIEVTKVNKKEYTERFSEWLQEVTLLVTYNDGTASEEISSNTAGVNMYLSCPREGEEIYQTDSIDNYLRNGGQIGTAEVEVTYKGAHTSYEITIQENPYERIEIEPLKKIFYDGCAVSDKDIYYSGDSAGRADIKVTAYRKDGKVEEYEDAYQLPYYSGVDCGIVYEYDENYSLYGGVDSFISAGGTYGTQTLRLEWMGLTADTEIEICRNPYDHVKVVTKPNKTTYLHNSYDSISLTGLEFYAYKDAEETEYDRYDYDSDEGVVENWYGDYFHETLGGHNSVEYLELGTHPVYLYFMGHKASYDIEVVDKMAESLCIEQAPRKLDYIVGETTSLSKNGLVLSITDLDGNVKRYQYGNYGEDGFENWDDIWDDLDYQYDIDWNTEGTYPVTVSYLGCSDTFEITVSKSPVKSFEILAEPKKNSYYQYKTEYDNIDLKGLSYRIEFLDGVVREATVKENTSRVSVSYQGVMYYLDAAWEKHNSDGYAALGENAVSLSFLGKTAMTDTITILDGPVKSLSLVKMPEKAMYLYHEPRVDLYGAVIRIQYLDGTAKDITVDEHTDVVKVEDENNESINAQRNGVSVLEGKVREYLIISYMNKEQEECLYLDFSKLSATPLQEESQVSTTLCCEKPYQLYSFTPETTGKYYFYTVGNEDTYIEIYNRNQLIFEGSDKGNYHDYETDEGDWDSFNEENGYAAKELKAGETYYYAVWMESPSYFENYRDRKVELQCCFSKEREQLSDEEIIGFEVVKAAKDTWYDFEGDSIYAGNLDLDGSVIRFTYANGWTEQQKLRSWYETEQEIHGKTLSIKWKYVTTNDWDDEYAEIREDNALVYTWGDITVEVPVEFQKESPVESLEIKVNPFVTKPMYEYQYQNGYSHNIFDGLSVLVHYKDGRADALLNWQKDKYENMPDPVLESYAGNASLEDIYDATADNTRKYLRVFYMGAIVKAELELLPNPVTEIEIVKMPEKMEFYPYEDIKADLYGMQAVVHYRAGGTKNVTVTEHTGSFEMVDDFYDPYLRADTETYWEAGQEAGVRKLFVEYLGCRQEVGTYAAKSFADLEAEVPVEAIAAGESRTVELDENKEYQVYRFVPEESGVYVFAAENGYEDNYGELYSASGTELISDDDGNYDNNFKITYSVTKGKTYYLVARMLSVGRDGSFTVTVSRGNDDADAQKEVIEKAELLLDAPVAGEWMQDVWVEENTFYLRDYTWYGADEDDRASYGTAHRLKLVLEPYSSYRFTSATQVVVNGKKIIEKSVGADGRLTLYYTFPYTACKVSATMHGNYELDESQHAVPGCVNYGENYRFRITGTDGSDTTNLIVKANDTVLKADADGIYTIENVRENVTVIVKSSQADADLNRETKLTMYNTSADVYDVIVGKRNNMLAENEGGEKSLPVLESYTDGSDQFFYGWYLDKDAELNGKGTRFTSRSLMELAEYDLYAKWASGFFTTRLYNKEIHYKILSIDEFNKMKVQVGDGAGRAARTISELKTAALAEDDTLEIPASFDANDAEALKELGIDLSECQVVAIAENAFAGESGLSAIKLPDTIEKIGANAFADCSSLKDVEIPSSVKEIAEGTFNGCTSLEKVALPEGISTIGKDAFNGCTSLTAVTIPDSVDTIDESAFAEGSADLTLICSTQMANSDVLQKVQETTGAKVLVVDLDLNYKLDEKEFTYGDSAYTFTASVTVDGQPAEREVSWTYPETDAYQFAADGNKLIVTPGRVTTEEEKIVVTVTDVESGKKKSVVLRTNGIDLGEVDGDGENLYTLKVLDAENLVYTGKEICPAVEVKETYTGTVLGAENYDLEYRHNTDAGQAMVVVSGKGAYSGTLEATFYIEKKEQTVTATKTIQKTTKDEPFTLDAKCDGEGSLAYDTSNDKVATVAYNGRVTIIGAGTAVITVWAPETANCKRSEDVKITITVTKAKEDSQTQTVKKAQTITANSVSKKYGDAAFNLNAKASGKGTLTYKSENQKVVKVNSKGQVTITGVGTAKVTIRAAETAFYKAAQKTVTVKVAQGDAKLTVAKKTLEKAYGSKAFSIGVKAKSKLKYIPSNTKIAKVDSKGRVTLKGAGKVVITVKTNDKNYKAASVKVTIKAAPKKAKVKSLKTTKKKGELLVTWNKQNEAGGYTVEYSTDKKFKKGVKSVTVKNGKTTSTTIRKLSAGKKYYVRVKAYSRSGGKLFGEASKALSKKVK